MDWFCGSAGLIFWLGYGVTFKRHKKLYRNQNFSELIRKQNVNSFISFIVSIWFKWCLIKCISSVVKPLICTQTCEWFSANRTKLITLTYGFHFEIPIKPKLLLRFLQLLSDRLYRRTVFFVLWMAVTLSSLMVSETMLLRSPHAASVFFWMLYQLRAVTLRNARSSFYCSRTPVLRDVTIETSRFELKLDK